MSTPVIFAATEEVAQSRAAYLIDAANRRAAGDQTVYRWDDKASHIADLVRDMDYKDYWAVKFSCYTGVLDSRVEEIVKETA
jgi:hypothetical protein